LSINSVKSSTTFEARLRGIQIDLRRVQRGNRRDIGQSAVLVGTCRARIVQAAEIIGDPVAQRLIFRVMVERGFLARPGDGDIENLGDRAARRVEYRHPVGEQQSLVDVIGDQDNRPLFLFANPVNLALQFCAGQRVERRQRLVEQQNLWRHGERPGHRHTLPHPARKFCRLAVDGMAQADQINFFADQRSAFGLGLSLVHGIDGKRDIAFDRQPREKRIGLEHETGLAARPRNWLALNQYFACIGFDQTRNERNQRGLAGARKPKDRQKLALCHRQIDIVQHRGPRIAFAQAIDLQRRCHHRPAFRLA
jgi:hypothetical protein